MDDVEYQRRQGMLTHVSGRYRSALSSVAMEAGLQITDAEDAVSEAVMKALDKIEGIGDEHFADEEALLRYLTTGTRNASRDLMRSERREHMREMAAAHRNRVASPVDVIIAQETRETQLAVARRQGYEI